MATPLKIRDAGGNIQELTTAEESYVAYQIGLHLAADSANGFGSITTNSSYTSVGSYTNTFFNEPVGTHPSTSITSGSTTSTLYQNQGGAAAETDSDVKIPLMWVDSGGQTGFKQMPDADLNEAVDRYLSTIFTNDYPGVFKLGSTSPGPDYSVWVSSVFTDTRTDGTSATYNIYRRDTYSAPTEIPPMFVRDSGGFDGIQAMTDRQIKYSFGQRAKSRIGTSKIGTYQLRSSASGAPTDPGTWISAGSAVDTKQTTSEQSFTSTYVGTYTISYTRNYTGNYQNTYTGAYNKAYTGTYTTNYITTYVSNYLKDYLATFYTSTFSATYAKQFLLNYTRLYTGNYTSFYNANYVRDYTRSVLYLSTYTINQFYENLFNVTYVGNFERPYSKGYTKFYTLDRIYQGGSATLRFYTSTDTMRGMNTVPGANLSGGGSTGRQQQQTDANVTSAGNTGTFAPLIYMGYPIGNTVTGAGGPGVGGGDAQYNMGFEYVGPVRMGMPLYYVSVYDRLTTSVDDQSYYVGPGFQPSGGIPERLTTQNISITENIEQRENQLYNSNTTSSGNNFYVGPNNPYIPGDNINQGRWYASAFFYVGLTQFFGAYTGPARNINFLGTRSGVPMSFVAFYQNLGYVGPESQVNYTGFPIGYGVFYTSLYSRTVTSNYTGTDYSTTYLRISTYDKGYTGAEYYTDSYNKAYVHGTIAAYAITYVNRDYIPYVTAYDGTAFVLNYENNYQNEYTRQYAQIYEDVFNIDYSTVFNVDYTSETAVAYESVFETSYVGNFEGLTIDATSETIETYTLYVRIS